MGKTGGLVPEPCQGPEQPVLADGGWGWGLLCWRGNKPGTPACLIPQYGLPCLKSGLVRSGSWLHRVPISSDSNTVGSHRDMVTIRPSATGPYPGVRLFSSSPMWLQVALVSLWLDFLQIPVTSCLIFWDHLLDHTNCNNCLQHADPVPDLCLGEMRLGEILHLSEMWELLPM